MLYNIFEYLYFLIIITLLHLFDNISYLYWRFILFSAAIVYDTEPRQAATSVTLPLDFPHLSCEDPLEYKRPRYDLLTSGPPVNRLPEFSKVWHTRRSDINVLYLHSCFQEPFQLPGSAAHSLLSETAASGRCSFRDDLNFHFSGSSLSSENKTEHMEQLVPNWLFEGQRPNTSWVGPRRHY